MLKSVRTGTALTLGFVAAFCAALLVGGLGVLGLRSVTDSVVELSDVALPNSVELGGAAEAQTTMAAALNQLMVDGLPKDVHAAALKDLEDAQQELAQHRKAWEALPSEPETLAAWNEMTRALDAWLVQVADLAAKIKEEERLLGAGTKADSAALQKVQQELHAAYLTSLRAGAAVDRLLVVVSAAQQKEVDGQEARGRAAAAQATSRMMWTLGLAAVLLLALGVVLVRHLTSVISQLVEETARITQEVAAGNISVRGDSEKVHFEFHGILDGINATLDAYQRPVKMAVENINRISKGEIPEQVSETFLGDFKTVADSVNELSSLLKDFAAAQATMAGRHDAGELDAVMPKESFPGAFGQMASSINALVQSHIAVKMRVVDVVGRYALGDFTQDMDRLPGQKARVTAAVDGVKASLKAVSAEIIAVAHAATQGQLSFRANADRFQHEFREMISGINQTLDAVVGPLKMAAANLDRISRGDIPPAITATYRGEFNDIKDSLNRCMGAVNLLVTDAAMLVDAAVAGNLSVRADGSRHQNDFRKVIEGVNKTLDAVMAPINEAAAVLEKLSQRDLRVRVKGAFKGDHQRITQSVNTTADALHDALAQVAEAVNQVSGASGQIAASSQSVAEGASEQASSLEETSSSLESMASMTRQSADNAQQANTLAAHARDAARDGGASMDQMVGAMQKIRASAEGTSQIIKDINDIAFQTNLLALNAAVEAARAGDAGRGFAVVAEEVRSLALRSKEAAMKTEELIRESVRQAGEGEATSKQVSAKLGEIGGAVGKVSDIVAEIAAAAKEQSSGIEQVNKAVAQMGKVTQQSAANSEESSSAAAELSGQSEELAAMVASFMLNRDPPKTARPAGKRQGAVTLVASPSRHGWEDEDRALQGF